MYGLLALQRNLLNISLAPGTKPVLQTFSYINKYAFFEAGKNKTVTFSLGAEFCTLDNDSPYLYKLLQLQLCSGTTGASRRHQKAFHEAFQNILRFRKVLVSSCDLHVNRFLRDRNLAFFRRRRDGDSYL